MPFSWVEPYDKTLFKYLTCILDYLDSCCNCFIVAKKLLIYVTLYSYTQNGCTPLHYAANHSYSNIAQLLLEKGADPHRIDKVMDIILVYIFMLLHLFPFRTERRLLIMLKMTSKSWKSSGSLAVFRIFKIYLSFSIFVNNWNFSTMYS